MSSYDEQATRIALAALVAAEYGSPEHDEAGKAAWGAMGAGCREQLTQLLQGPTWDGDVVSKLSRGRLLDLGLAVRCCSGGKQGYTAASYLAHTVHEIGERVSDCKQTSLDELEAEALETIRDVARYGHSDGLIRVTAAQAVLSYVQQRRWAEQQPMGLSAASARTAEAVG